MAGVDLVGGGEEQEQCSLYSTLRCRFGSVSYEVAEEGPERLVVVGRGGGGIRDGLVMMVPWPLAA